MEFSLTKWSGLGSSLEPPGNRRVAMGATEGLWQGKLPSVPQRLHYLLHLITFAQEDEGSSVLNLLCATDQTNENEIVGTDQVFSSFSSKL